MLLEHGSFEKIEGVLERWHIEKEKRKDMGGSYTKKALMDEHHFTQPLN